MNEKKIVAILKELKTIFDKHEIPFWLDWGTLLGVVRDNKLVDEDIDLATWDIYADKIKSISHELHAKGFETEIKPISIIINKDCFYSGLGFYHLDEEKQRTPLLLI